MSKNNKGFALVPVLVVIGLLIVGGIAYMYISGREKIWVQSPSPTATSSVNSDWKTYAFAALTFQYPSDWNVRTDNDLGAAITTPPNPKDQNDNIVLQLKQSNCDPNNSGKCNYIDASGGAVYDLHTFSTNQNTLDVYQKILDSIKENGVKPSIRQPSLSQGSRKTYRSAQYGFELDYPTNVALPYDSAYSPYYPAIKAGLSDINFFASSESKLMSQVGDVDGSVIGFLSFVKNKEPIIQISVMQKPTGFTTAYDYVSKKVQQLSSKLELGGRLYYVATKTTIGGRDVASLVETTGSAGTPGITRIYVENSGYLIIFAYRNYESSESGGKIDSYNEVGFLVVNKILETVKFF